MFRLSQSTRRRLFRTGFLLVCVAPLVALVAAGFWQRQAGYIHAHETALRHVLGMHVHIGHIVHPRPGIVRYQEVHLVNPESGHTFAKFRMVEVREPAGADKPTELTIAGTTIEPGATASLYGMAKELLRGSFRSEDLYLTFATDAISFDETAPFPELNEVSGAIHVTDKEAAARFEFRSIERPKMVGRFKPADPAVQTDKRVPVPGFETADAEDKIVLRMVRSRQNGAAVEEFEFHTGSVALPCETLEPLAGGELTGLAGSHFQGSVWAAHDKGVVVRGDLLGVNLQRLVGDPFGHRIDGKADVRIHESHFVDGRLTDAEFAVDGGPGAISLSLLSATASGLKLGPRYSPVPPDDMFDYTQLAASLHVNNAGEIKITGGCTRQDGSPTDVVLMAPDYKVWWKTPPPPEQPLPLSAMLRALAPPNGPTAPASTQIGWLMERLPIEKTARHDPALTPVVPPNVLRETPPQKPREAPPKNIQRTSGAEELPAQPGYPGPYGK